MVAKRVSNLEFIFNSRLAYTVPQLFPFGSVIWMLWNGLASSLYEMTNVFFCVIPIPTWYLSISAGIEVE